MVLQCAGKFVYNMTQLCSRVPTLAQNTIQLGWAYEDLLMPHLGYIMVIWLYHGLIRAVSWLVDLITILLMASEFWFLWYRMGMCLNKS